MVASFVSDGGAALLHFWRKKVLYQMVIQLRLEAFQLKKKMLMDSHLILCCYLLLFQFSWTRGLLPKGDEIHGHVLHIYGKIIVKYIRGPCTLSSYTHLKTNG